ncbi:MAG TPA: RsmG family class I SAM-dependent methyltransferase [Gaiellales bacterium]|nr:RsmG family class I SAM-dependent methyltransferase [Gaiellales bacterium]HVI36449.1 RsmG family class I SAM-dependent methyltransferase [Gaiellales bacterium]
MKHPPPALEHYCRLVADAPLSVTALPDLAAIRRELVEDTLRARPLIGESLPELAVDVGSGNGSPGIPLAIDYGRPVTLLEAASRKAAFLRRVLTELGIEAPVVAERSEQYARAGGRDRFDLVLARALAPPPVALELCLPLARAGGRVLLWTGEVDGDAIDEVAGQLAARVSRVEPYGGRRLVEVAKLGPTPERFPRRPGMAGKRPLAPLPSR